jgi:hypothetical protein
MSKAKTKATTGPRSTLPTFVEATADYEAWLGRHITLLPHDLRLKHERMKQSPLGFLRATFYRWMQLWPIHCPELLDAKPVLAVGDLHIENFGTWRDVEGRLIWGVNDFDEAYDLPYALDLVRLAASAVLAIKGGELDCAASDACRLILAGYAKTIEAGGRPFVLSGGFDWLRALAMADLRDPKAFAAKMETLPAVDYPFPAKIKRALAEQMPQPGLTLRFKHRVAGLGSLGRQRVVALGDYYGGLVAREAKALAPSACAWAAGSAETGLAYDRIAARAERCPDPFVRVRGRWVVRRLAADSSSIGIDRLPKGKEEKLLTAMGHETANIHLGSARGAIARDLKGRPDDWLEAAAHRMAEATLADWAAWKAAG